MLLFSIQNGLQRVYKFILYRINWVPKELFFEARVYKTTDKKRLSTNKTKNYDYGAINIRSPGLAKFIGKKAHVTIKIEK